jgi:ribosome maturation factor RimP
MPTLVLYLKGDFMQTKDIIAKVEKYAEPVIVENGYELVEVEYVKEGPNFYLRIYADKEGGFSIDDCEKVSRFVEKELENEDISDKPYILEVSSPGIDRVLKKDKEYIKYKGRLVDVKLYKPIDKVKEFQGTLIGLEDDNIKIISDGSELSFNRKDVAVCRLAVVF